MVKPNLALKSKIVEKFGTQEKFALKLRVSSTLVSNVTTGRWILEDHEQRAWAKCLGYPVTELFKNECSHNCQKEAK